jgi:serine/threonine protein kinase
MTLRPSSGDGSATVAGAAVGTQAYMSPEQAEGRQDLVGPASDVYSLGATLYALLTGQAPFRGDDPGELLRRVSRGEWPPPRQVKKGVPAALDAICRKAMALKPEDRYATAACSPPHPPSAEMQAPPRRRTGRSSPTERAALRGGSARAARVAGWGLRRGRHPLQDKEGPWPSGLCWCSST